jgi:dephospho-CoA kinase
MARWPGHYVIGLTGNIGAGKSVARKMLEHLGAFGIDADGLSHAAMSKGAPAYGPRLW